MPNEIADIIPRPAEASDRLLVRADPSAPFDLDALSDITPEELVALAAELAAARGDRSALALRLGTISNFASPNAGGVIVGQYYDNAFHGTASSTLAGATNRVDMAPFYTSTPLRINQLGVAVSTGAASTSVKVFIYGSNAEGWPDDLLYETAALSSATATYVFETLDFTFDSGRQYWVGVRHSGTATVRAINVSSACNLGLTSNTASNYATILRRTITFADPLPANWNFLNSDRVANVTPPSIRMRAAAL
ncbi:MAG: hypothetical protein LPK02_06915 [Rhodobacterales bacterium]|nr:hypothetical protein [Rhodobacterales bacterium]